ncbi:conserved hypothetical protein [Methylobacterium sp. 4-46]|uniref:hypothetical protein n=1 Tax=unclassified Methylobacterium TaxID=2615210 RepID=UPI000152E54E|nr:MULTISPECIES: hypothetical protein [Methylobacterium]ACA17445.1 conserved hypothetical protein [Methylobacterium sp. 4-46]WFT83130.1 hypothetical protein QA634_15395 [Methylobacterium nodulans]
MIIRHHAATDAFTRLHRTFTVHLGIALVFAWGTALAAACYAPWVRNIRPLLDPGSGRVESTLSFLFAMPVVLTLAWAAAQFGRETLRRTQLLANAAAEFALAAAVAFGVFYVAIDRAVAALSLGF